MQINIYKQIKYSNIIRLYFKKMVSAIAHFIRPIDKNQQIKVTSKSKLPLIKSLQLEKLIAQYNFLPKCWQNVEINHGSLECFLCSAILKNEIVSMVVVISCSDNNPLRELRRFV